MTNKSRLLEYVLGRAKLLGGGDITANGFVLALLALLADFDSQNLPSEVDCDDVKAELKGASDMFSRFDFDGFDAITALGDEITSPDYDADDDCRIFRAVSEELEAKATDADPLTVLSYLDRIIANPTPIIGRAILGIEPSATPSVEEWLSEILENVYSDGDTDATDEGKGNTEGSVITEAVTEEKASGTEKLGRFARWSKAHGIVISPINKEGEKEEKEIPGVKRLSDIVKKTRDIQNLLLENIFGQDQAVSSFVSGYFQAQLMSLSRNGTRKPQATFLFAGPPGVGKTFLAEKAAEALGLPYQRFDMSEYADKEANIEFCGSDQVYKNGKAGNVTSFVAENPHCVLLFDEIEKAHLNVIHLFLQILDAGRIRDNFTDEEVSFSDAVIIFTTNAGKGLYEDPSVVNLSNLPRKRILAALGADINPVTEAPLFPAAICSRFASGNVVMFNHLEASNLFTIAKHELQKNVDSFERTTGIKITVDDRVGSAIMLAEGGKADARTVKGRANAFFHEELYELFRLMSPSGVESVERLSNIDISVPTDELDGDIAAMFENPATPEVLVFAGEELSKMCKNALNENVCCHIADNIDDAKDILFNHDINIVLCDIGYNAKPTELLVLNREDVSSEGHDFLTYVLGSYSIPSYVLQRGENEISSEEFLSFARLGVRDVLTVSSDGFYDEVISRCRTAYQQGNMLKLARENKSLSYKTAQMLSRDKKTASIRLVDFSFNLITDVDDSKNLLDNVSRPNVHFADVIGAEDAKAELGYFVEYLKNPTKYMRMGVRSPKGVLLWGPPGTGKTLLAKAMAGECGVTFLKAEGNEFLKRYVGEGSEAVHSLFNAARKYAPSIIFIDEIDAIGKDRSALSAGDSTANVLTAFLTEMDGFNTDTTKPVFVLAATNYGVDAERGKSLDPALLRRFDRRIYVDLPNKEERRRYLEMKLSKNRSVSLSDEQLENIAIRSTGMSLAELESVFEMALRGAIRSENGSVGDAEFEEAFETFNSGEKKEWSSDSLLRTARHEAGHALICWLGGEKPSYLTVVARGDHGGYMQHANSENKGLYTRRELLDKIRTSLGGRAAEIVYYGSEDGASTGAGGDLHSATSIAEQMICNYGMDEGVGLSYIGTVSDVGADYARVLRDRVNEILSEQLQSAISVIEDNKRAIDALVDALMDKNHLKEKEIDDILKDNCKIESKA